MADPPLRRVAKGNPNLRTKGGVKQKVEDLVLSDRWKKFPLCWAGIFAIDFVMAGLRKKINRFPSHDEFGQLLDAITQILSEEKTILWAEGDGGDGFYGFLSMHHLFKSPLTGKCSQCGDRNPIVSGVKLHEFLTSRVSKMFSPGEGKENKEEIISLNGKKCSVVYNTNVGPRSGNEDEFVVLSDIPFLLSCDALRCLSQREHFFKTLNKESKKEKKSKSKKKKREGEEEREEKKKKKKHEEKGEREREKEREKEREVCRALSSSPRGEKEEGGEKEKEKEKEEEKEREKEKENYYGLPTFFCGVYDGHHGRQAAEWVRIFLHLLILSDPEITHNPQAAFIRAFTDLDSFINEQAETAGWSPGSTALTALFYSDRILLANVGDCQAVLCRNGVAIDLVSPHSPGRVDEKIRLIESGVTVEFFGTWRVNGMLAVSRSIGDLALKNSVCPTPEVSEIKIHELDEFLLIASDGLWDVLTSQDAVDFVRNELATGKKSSLICTSLVEKALGLKSQDNVTIVLLVFQNE